MTQTNTNQKLDHVSLTFRLTPDTPTTEDAFGAHELLADSIAETIQVEIGGKAIALEGSWGSGKSSIVEMLRKRFRGQINGQGGNNVSVFLFDAWSHEGDPLRRVFLEELLAFCKSEFDYATKENWAEREKTEITGRSKNIKQKSTPILRSAWPLFVVALLSMFPVAVAAVGGLFRQNLADPLIWRLLIASLIVASIIPIGAMFLAIYCAWPIWPFSNWTWSTPRLTREKRREKASRLISLYAKKVDEDIETTAHESQGPTSIEFQRYFAQLMREYLGKQSRKILIVLDNLDRIPTESAKALWTTLRVFADCCEDPRNFDWSSRAWFLVPYDPVSANRLWDDGKEENLDTPKQNKSVKSTNSANDEVDSPSVPKAPRLSSAFLDKTFQVRFDVPPILLSDWKQYLSTQLKSCLGSDVATDSEVHFVYILSRRMSELRRRPPTPRHLKLFTNDIVALYRRFKHTFKIRHLALYAMLRRQGHDVRLWLLENKNEHQQFDTLFADDDYKSVLCAMAHGITDTEKARDLHLRIPIESAMATGDSPALKELTSSYGFWQVFELLCDDSTESFGNDSNRILNAMKAIHESKILESKKPENRSVKQFLTRLVTIADWNGLNENNADGFICAIQLGIDDQSLNVHLANLTSLSEVSEPDSFEPENWVAGLIKIATFLESTGKLADFKEIVTLPQTIANHILAALGKAVASEIDVCAKMICFENAEDVLAGLLPEATTVWDETKSQSLKAATYILEENIDSEIVSKAIQARLSSDEELKHAEIDRIVHYLQLLEYYAAESVKTIAEELTKNGFLYRRVKNLERYLQSQTVGKLFRWIIQYGDLSEPPSVITGAQEGYSFAKNFVNAPKENLIAYKEILDSCISGDDNEMLYSILMLAHESHSLATSIILDLCTQEKLGKILTPALYCECFKEISELANSDTENLLQEISNSVLLLDYSDFAAALEDLKIDRDNIPPITALVRAGATNKSESFSKNVQDWIEKRTKEEWETSLQTDDGVSSLTITFRKANPQFEFSGELASAVEALLSEIVLGNIAKNEINQNFKEIVEILPKSRQQTIANRVVQRSDDPDNCFPIAIPLFCHPLAEAAAIYSNESFVRNVILPLIERRESDGIEWLQNLVMLGFPWWKSASEDDRSTFADELNNLLQSCEEDMKTKLKSIGDKLGIELVNDKSDEEDNIKD